MLRKYSTAILIFAAILTVAGGFVAFSLKNALLPPVKRPQISVSISWPNKLADEIEQTLVIPLERNLKTLKGVTRIKTNVRGWGARTVLTFSSNVDMDKTYIEVLSRVSQIPGWPAEVPAPKVFNRASGGGDGLGRVILSSPDNKTEAEFSEVILGEIKPELLKIEGVAHVDTSYQPTEQRVDLEFDPERLAQYGLTIDQVAQSVSQLKDRSGGYMQLSSKIYDIQLNGKKSLDQFGETPVAVLSGHIVRLEDLADIHLRPIKEWSAVTFNGDKGVYFVIEAAIDVNALETMKAVRKLFERLNSTILKKYNMQVGLSHDDSDSIEQALEQVYVNLLLGVLLACTLLGYFFKRLKVIALIVITVPLCLSLVALAMRLGDFSLNVISLAGVALSVGLLLDAAIIVIDNIVRHLQQGEPLNRAIEGGVSEVKGAIISSTLSSIVIFIPIVLIQSPEGQVFVDLAFTISSSLSASVLAALVVVPAAARVLLANKAERGSHVQGDGSSGLIDVSTVSGKASKDVWVKRFSLSAHYPFFRYAMLIVGLPVAILVPRVQ